MLSYHPEQSERLNLSLEFFNHEKSERLKYSLPFNDTKKAKGLRHFLEVSISAEAKVFKKEFLKFLTFFNKKKELFNKENI